jgi:hypothetical protein
MSKALIVTPAVIRSTPSSVFAHLLWSPWHWQRGTLHVGDRFTNSGNDNAARSICSILWVANPDETAFFIKILLNDVRAKQLDQAAPKNQPYVT